MRTWPVIAAVVLVAGGYLLLAGPTTPPRLSGDQLEAGTYQLRVLGFLNVWGGVNATITVPEGWENLDGGGVSKDSTVVRFWPSDSEVAHVYADPCYQSDGFVDPPVGPTVDDLATALADQPRRGDAVPTAVTIDGYRGKLIKLSVPADLDIASCDGGLFVSWEGRIHHDPGQLDWIYVLNVDGQRLLIYQRFDPGTSEAARAEQQAVFDSIHLDGDGN